MHASPNLNAPLSLTPVHACSGGIQRGLEAGGERELHGGARHVRGAQLPFYSYVDIHTHLHVCIHPSVQYETSGAFQYANGVDLVAQQSA